MYIASYTTYYFLFKKKYTLGVKLFEFCNHNLNRGVCVTVAW